MCYTKFAYMFCSKGCFFRVFVICVWFKKSGIYRQDIISEKYFLFKVPQKANRLKCGVCLSPPLGIAEPAMITVFVLYNLIINYSIPLNKSLNIAMAHHYDEWWGMGIGKNVTSTNATSCSKLSHPLYVVGKHGTPLICYKLIGKGGNIGKTRCPKGLMVDISALNIYRT